MFIYFEEEQVADILKKSPVKFIIRCMCVCKSWRSLISSPNFISAHLRKPLASDNKFAQAFVFQRSSSKCTECNLLQFDESHQIYHFHSMLFHLSIDPETRLNVVGCVNGLMCFTLEDKRKHDTKFIIFNPEIGRFRLISPPRRVYTPDFYVKGFGFDKSTLDYKLFLTKGKLVYLYSLNLNSWSRISCQYFLFLTSRFQYVVFANDCFHWVAYDPGDEPELPDRPFIMVFDLKSETFGRIPMPQHLSGDLIITKHGDSSIGIIQRVKSNLTDVWIMEKLGRDEWSWVKVASAAWIGNRTKTVLEKQEVVGFRNKDELFIRFFNGVLASLNIKNQAVCNLSDIDVADDFEFSAHTHVPSLVLLGTEDV